MPQLTALTVLLLLVFACSSQPQSTETYQDSVPLVNENPTPPARLLVGAEQFAQYVPLIGEQRVGMVVNQTSEVGGVHLVDTLLSLGVKVKKIFAPEHGFRGDADAGAIIKDGVDSKTGLPVISIYGKNKKPTPEHLAELDVLIFDIQDVGARFYTYISSMHYVMEACAEEDKRLFVLDRPNPNGHYVDGPVRQEGFESFVGMHPIPVVHGLTVGELAKMINGEKWLKNGVQCPLSVVSVASGYDHTTDYSLPVSPSPNLPNDQAIAWYPSLCLFEGTMMSIGRGTTFPFQVVGYPESEYGNFTFTPISIPGAATHPKLEDQLCYGIDLRETPAPDAFSLELLLRYYQIAGNHEKFIDRSQFFNLLAGTDALQNQLKAGLSEAEIRESWQPELQRYKTIRKKYLLYPDFE